MVHDILDLIKRGFPGATAATILLFIVWYLVMPVISIHLTLMKFLSAALAICLILSFIIALLGAFLELFDRFLQIIHRHDHHKVDIERKKAELEVRQHQAKWLKTTIMEATPPLLTGGDQQEES